MDELNTIPVVHYFDTELRRILCGASGPDQRSTKHARGVSCPACVGLMSTRAAASAPARPEIPAGELLS
jgi:hypothetical protein